MTTSSKYLTAREAAARTIAAKSLDGNYMRAETDAIITRIAAESDKGNNTIYIGTIDPTIIGRLQALGYTVNSASCQRDGNSSTVTW